MASRSGTRTSWRRTPGFEDTKEYIEAKVSRIVGESEEMREARDLIIISAPNEVEPTLREPGLHPAAGRGHKKDRCRPRAPGILEAATDLRVRAVPLRRPLPAPGRHRLRLQCPGNFTCRFSRSVSRWSPPSTWAETSKNIDRIFDLAKKLAPCILFIDEFDFVAKTRVSDDHGAMKRAVNMLLKNIDPDQFREERCSPHRATNHPPHPRRGGLASVR